jgi:hypothetical protein
MAVQEGELWEFVLADKLGSGQTRDTYLCALNSETVVKVERELPAFDNFTEFDLWKNMSHNFEAQAKRWLVPCRRLSQGGKYLVMDRCWPIKDWSVLPKRIPAWLKADAHVGNWGVDRSGRAVCLDYANHYIFRLMKANAWKLEPVKWRA